MCDQSSTEYSHSLTSAVSHHCFANLLVKSPGEKCSCLLFRWRARLRIWCCPSHRLSSHYVGTSRVIIRPRCSGQILSCASSGRCLVSLFRSLACGSCSLLLRDDRLLCSHAGISSLSPSCRCFKFLGPSEFCTLSSHGHHVVSSHSLPRLPSSTD